jgi:hypothetical protein
VLCEGCDSQLRFTPGADELEVLRTREEMILRERIAVERQYVGRIAAARRTRRPARVRS